jgi:cupin fold WbuC family metalloprotein
MTKAVFYTNERVIEVGQEWYEKLKGHAFEAERKRARLCLHRSPDDLLHEMIIVFHRDAVIQPHRHRNKSESFHIIFGELDIVLFDSEGEPTRVISMGELGSEKTHVYRLSDPAWHSVIIRSEFAAIHEITNGPFRVEDNELAPWAPTDPIKLRTFLERSIEKSAATARSRVPRFSVAY